MCSPIMSEDIEQYEQVLLRQLFKIPGVAKVHSSIVLREVKADGKVPI